MNKFIIFVISAALFVLQGCSLLEIPNPNDVVNHPLGTESIRIGMSKAQVESLWGKPSSVRLEENKEKWQGAREAWTYQAQYGSIPIDAGYLSKTKKLYFDGNNLVDIVEK